MLKQFTLGFIIFLGTFHGFAYAIADFKTDARRCTWNARTAVFIKQQALTGIPDDAIRAKMLMRLEALKVPKGKEAAKERMKKETMESLDLVLNNKEFFRAVPDSEFFDDIYLACVKDAW